MRAKTKIESDCPAHVWERMKTLQQVGVDTCLCIYYRCTKCNGLGLVRAQPRMKNSLLGVKPGKQPTPVKCQAYKCSGLADADSKRRRCKICNEIPERRSNFWADG